jgi:transmembrane sensor
MADTDPYTEFQQKAVRYLSGELTQEEKKQFEELLAADPDLATKLEELRKIWDAVDGLAARQGYDLDAEWEGMKARLPGFGNGRETAGRNAMPARTETPGAVRKILVHTYRIAAVLIVGLLFAVAWLYTQRFAGTIMAAAGDEALEIHLEDGSLVVLNRHSRIRYPRHMNGDERHVSLQGEAWFEVDRDSLRPFVIDAGAALVEVLGTRFNVNAYRENPTVEITVESGMVSLTAKEDRQEQIVLRAGNSGTCHKHSHELVLVPSSDPNKLSWKTRELFFDHTSLAEVADLVGKVYGVDIKIVNSELASCPITVTFRDQSLDAVLKVLEQTLDLEVSRTGSGIVLDGEACYE